MPYTNILPQNNELYNFLNDVNYGMSNPQFHHLTSIIDGLINVAGNKSLSSIAKNIVASKDDSCIYKFLSKSDWYDQLLNQNRINYLDLCFNNIISPDSTGFLAIDDTVNNKETAKKIQGLSYNYSHSENKNIWSHCVVTSNFVAGDMSIPLQYQPYYKEDQCNQFNKQFKSKVDIAKDFINNFKVPSNCSSIYCLLDSWFVNNPIIEAALAKGIHTIGTLKSNRIIYPQGIRMQLTEFTKYIDPNALDLVTVNGKDYRVFVYEGPVSSFPNAKVVISYEVANNSFKDPVFIMSTDITLGANTIIEYYSIRWTIETNYKYLKSNLGFDKYRVRGIISIERYFLIVFLAINFLELFRITMQNLNLETIGEAIDYNNNLSKKQVIEFVYHQARNNVSLDSICNSLKIAC